MNEEIITHQQQEIIARPDEMSVEDLMAQVKKVKTVMDMVMKKDEHYGIIPGTNKPTLLKPGAEKLCLTFRLDPQYESAEIMDGVHLTVKSKCTLYHIPTSMRLGSGEGSCSTKESKYAYRKQGRVCPKCGRESIITGKKEYGGGFVCFAKKGGCNAKFKEDDASITSQAEGRVPNEDVADQYNTVLKMANKRSLIAAVLNVTAASDIFTQDVEDLNRKEAEYESSKPQTEEAAFDPRAEHIEKGKYAGTLWIEVPADYLEWASKQSGDLALKGKATLTYMEANRAPETPSPFDGVFDVPKTEETSSQAIYERLAGYLQTISNEGTLSDLEKWGTDHKDEIKTLPAEVQESLRKAYKEMHKRMSKSK